MVLSRMMDRTFRLMTVWLAERNPASAVFRESPLTPTRVALETP